jgi:hypothetical protein
MKLKVRNFHGIALITLGLMFFMGQALVSIRKNESLPQRTSVTDSESTSQPRELPFFGIMGGVTTLIGLSILIIPKKILP